MVTKIQSRSTAFAGYLAPIGSVLAYLGSTAPSTPSSPGTATLTFGDTEFNDVNNGTLSLTSTDGTVRVYKIRNDAGASTNLEFNAGASATVCATNMKTAIEHADGHNGKITVTQTDGTLTLVQATLGIDGNTPTTTAANFNLTCDVNIGATFTGGASDGWLYCDGSVVSRAVYAALFANIGTTYGVGDGSTTFALPDLRGRLLVGRDSMGPAANAGRMTASPEGLDGATLGSAGARVAIADVSKSQGLVCNWIIRASQGDI